VRPTGAAPAAQKLKRPQPPAFALTHPRTYAPSRSLSDRPDPIPTPQPLDAPELVATEASNGSDGMETHSLSVAGRTTFWPWRWFRAPALLLRRNRSIFGVFFGAVLFNVAQPRLAHLKLTKAGWIFDHLIPSIVSALDSVWIWLLLIGLYIVRTAITLLVSEEIMLMFRGRRQGTRSSLHNLKPRDGLWLGLVGMLCYIVAIAALALVYLPMLLLWRDAHVDLGILLLGLVALGYPVYYASVAAVSMVAVFPIASNARFRILRKLTRLRVAGRLYVFYGVRILIELLLLFVVPALVAPLHSGRIIGTISVSAGILIPFTLLQGAAYQFKLVLLADDPIVHGLFSAHLATNPLR
jgi:hypothetical protein